MIEPYNAVGLIPTMWGIRRREDMQKNIDHLHSLTRAACWLTNLDIPVRLVAVPEGALQGFNDEILDVDHADFARKCAIDIPGRETEELGKIAREFDVYLMAQAKARHEDWPDLFFNYYRGAIVGRQHYSGTSTFVTGAIHIEALRHQRARAQVTNWLKDVRTEMAQLLYEQPLYPKNRYLEARPPKHAQYREEVIEKNIARMQERGIWKKPWS